MRASIARNAERFVYVYDYDYWRHDVIVEQIRDSDPDAEYPVSVDGERGCPPENVGGTYGFMDIPEADLDRTHEEHQEMLDW